MSFVFFPPANRSCVSSSTEQGTGQFIKACIVVTPLEGATNLVEVELLPDLKHICGEIEPKILSNLGAPLYARQLAIHLNVSTIFFHFDLSHNTTITAQVF